MAKVAPARFLLAAKDLVDARYFEPLTVADMAALLDTLPDSLVPERMVPS